MKRLLHTIAVNVDVFVALLLSVLVGVLDVAGGAPASLINGATLLVLAAIATALLHNRLSSQSSDARLEMRFARWFGDEAVTLLQGADLHQELVRMRRAAESWEFKGGTGIYNRAVTLPEIAEKSHRDRKPHSIVFEILDPMDLELCRRYEEFFATVPDRATDGNAVSILSTRGADTRCQVLATILAACWYYQKSSLLQVDIRLSAEMTILRWDLSSDRLVISTREARYPALLLKRGNPYFAIWQSELHISRSQARRLPVEAVQDSPLSDQPTVDEVRALFERLRLPLPSEFTDEDVAHLNMLAFHRADPYG